MVHFGPVVQFFVLQIFDHSDLTTATDSAHTPTVHSLRNRACSFVTRNYDFRYTLMSSKRDRLAEYPFCGRISVVDLTVCHQMTLPFLDLSLNKQTTYWPNQIRSSPSRLGDVI